MNTVLIHLIRVKVEDAGVGLLLLLTSRRLRRRLHRRRRNHRHLSRMRNRVVRRLKKWPMKKNC